MSRNPDVVFTAEYIKKCLYFATVRPGKTLHSNSDVFYFCVDNELVYENYYSDFGPLNLGCVYRYCKLLNEKLKQCVNKQIVVHYTSTEPKAKTNAAFLLGCFGVLYLKMTPMNALKPLVVTGQSYRPFQDATQGDSLYTITLLDCLYAIKKARSVGFFNFQDFYYEEYERLDKIQGGDLNWIVPGKFLAFIGPVDYSVSLYHPPEMYIDYFKENNVRIVIRLNKRMYDAQVFINNGILHYDLFFPDGSCPPRHILMKFLQISEEFDGAIAVHCKAGLGRTGSLIGCYLIKHYRMTAREAIGWMRICRPGSVIGHQQGWLEQLEPWLIKQGNIYRSSMSASQWLRWWHNTSCQSSGERKNRDQIKGKRMYEDPERFPVHEFGVYSIAEKMRKQKLAMFKPPSPSITRAKPSKQDTLPVPVACKTPKANQSDRRVSTKTSNASKLLINNQRISKGTQQMGASPPATRRSSGGGEPRAPAVVTHQKEHNYSYTVPSLPNDTTPVPTFRTTEGPMIKTLSDAKNYLIRSSIHAREKNLLSSVVVTPFKTSGVVYKTENLPSYYDFSARGSAPTNIIPPPRRRPLGRSPSPSPPTSPMRLHLSRGTDPLPDRNSLKEAISGLRMALGQRERRDGSIGAPSVGVASLGAARDAPSAPRAPSVRSDERPLATQGDMLNSIKFQRRYRSTMHSEKIVSPIEKNRTSKPSVQARESRDGRDKAQNIIERNKLLSSQRLAKTEDSRWLNGKLNSGWRPTPALVHSPSREGRVPASLIPGRPRSPSPLSPHPSRLPNAPHAPRPASPRARPRSPCY